MIKFRHKHSNRDDITVAMAVKAYEKAGSLRGAAKILGIHHNAVRRRLVANTETEAMPPPEGQVTAGVSTLYGEDGSVKLQWVKTKTDEEARLRAVEAAIEAMCAEVIPQKPIAAPALSMEALCNLYTLTDLHVGMHAWHKESGADWDLAIAEQVIKGCFAQMIASSPPAALGIVNQMGDFLHTDSFKAMTPASGHMLDADSRYQKIVEVGVRIMRFVINQALAKHQKVIVTVLDANHDPVGQTWQRVMLSALYENEPRIQIITSPSPFVALQHGKVMLCFHHGHLVKNDKLQGKFSALFPELWGATKRRYCHTGHLHHVEEKENDGLFVIRHPTLAAADAYSHRAGYIADRSATSICYHAEFGQVGRQTIVPEMLSI